MTVAPDLHKQVTHNTEDIDALHDLLKKTNKRVKKIDREHGARLERIEDTQVAHSEKLDSHSEKLDTHSEKLDTILELLRQDE